MNTFSLTTNSPLQLGQLLVGRINSVTLPRATLWLFPPGVAPVVGQPWREIKRQRVWDKSVHTGSTFRLRTGRLKRRGWYTLVAHVPNEPGSIAGNYEKSISIEIT